jgi:hypothetical protein
LLLFVCFKFYFSFSYKILAWFAVSKKFFKMAFWRPDLREIPVLAEDESEYMKEILK